MSVCYAGSQFALFRQEGFQELKDAWDLVPVVIAERKVKLYPLEAGLKVLEGALLMPSQVAKIQPAASVVVLVDRLFQKTLKGYHDDLLRATRLDIAEYTELQKRCKVKEEYYPLERCWMEIFEGKLFLDRETLSEKTEAMRLQWFTKVAEAEKARLERVKELLFAAIPVIREALQLTPESDSLRQEADEVQAVYKALFNELPVAF